MGMLVLSGLDRPRTCYKPFYYNLL